MCALVRAPHQRFDGRDLLVFGDHLGRWRTKLAASRYRQAQVLALGNSIVKGEYSNDSATTDEAIWRERGWVPQLRSLFADRYGVVGEGLIANNDVRLSASAGVLGIASTGLVNQGKRIDSGDTLTYTLPACTTITINWWWESNAASAAFTYTVDGGSPMTATAPSGSDLYPIEVADSLTDTTHTLVISGPASGHADISAVGCWETQASGVAVHRLGVAGGYVENGWLFNDTAANMTRASKLAINQPAVDLLILAFGHNEALLGQPLGKTPATYAALLTTIVDYATNQEADCLILAGPRSDPTHWGTQPDSSQYTDDAYFTASEAVAAANEHCAFLDTRPLWGDWATANNAGLQVDYIHPTLLGHSDMAKLIFEAIGGV